MLSEKPQGEYGDARQASRTTQAPGLRGGPHSEQCGAHARQALGLRGGAGEERRHRKAGGHHQQAPASTAQLQPSRQALGLRAGKGEADTGAAASYQQLWDHGSCAAEQAGEAYA